MRRFIGGEPCRQEASTDSVMRKQDRPQLEEHRVVTRVFFLPAIATAWPGGLVHLAARYAGNLSAQHLAQLSTRDDHKHLGPYPLAQG